MINSVLKQRILILISVLVFLILLVPYLFASFCACPSADDFSNLSRALSQKTNSFTINALFASINVYFGWQGTYTATFLSIWGAAIYWYGGLVALRIEYVFSILFFSFSVGFVLYEFMEVFDFQKPKRINYCIASTSVFIFIALYNYNVCEIFYWHTGIAAYTVPVSFSLLTIGLIVKENYRWRDMVLSLLLALLSAGGALDISAFVTGSVFLVAVYKAIYKKKIDILSALTFFVALVGSIINVISPGNFIRHSAFSDEFPVLYAMTLSIKGVINANLEMVKNGTILLIVFICLFMYNKLSQTHFRFQNPFILGSLLFFGSIIIDFPVFLGYAGGELQLRGVFVRRVSMTLFYFLFSANLTGWIANKIKKRIDYKIKFKLIMGILVAISMFILCAPVYWDSVVPFKIWRDMINPTEIKRFESTNNGIIGTLTNSPNEDVIIYVDSYDDRGYLKGFGLEEDKEFWINKQMSKYFGNKSITFKIGHE